MEVVYIDGAPVAVELPKFVELAIVKTDPGVRGDTARAGPSRPRSRRVPSSRSRSSSMRATSSRSTRGAARTWGAWRGRLMASRGRAARSQGDRHRDTAPAARSVPRAGPDRDRGERSETRPGAARARPGAPSAPAAAPAARRDRGGGPGSRFARPAPELITDRGANGRDLLPRRLARRRALRPRRGRRIKEGQILCIIEAMKLMNEIESKVAGRVVKILVENGQPVEYGQPLVLIDPAG